MHTGREQGGRERGETRVWLRADSMWGSPERSSHRVLRRTGGAVAQEGEVSTNGETSSAIGTRAKHKTRPPKIQTFCHAGSAQGPSRLYPGMACFPLEVFRCKEQTLGGILSLKMAQLSTRPSREFKRKPDGSNHGGRRTGKPCPPRTCGGVLLSSPFRGCGKGSRKRGSTAGVSTASAVCHGLGPLLRGGRFRRFPSKKSC